VAEGIPTPSFNSGDGSVMTDRYRRSTGEVTVHDRSVIRSILVKEPVGAVNRPALPPAASVGGSGPSRWSLP
jgi:hypothetical protein